MGCTWSQQLRTEAEVIVRGRVRYAWIDPNIRNRYNSNAYKVFQNYFNMDAFSSLEGFKNFLLTIQDTEKIKVLAASSLPKDHFIYLQEEQKVSQIFIFCLNQERAKLLQKYIPKIKGYGLSQQSIIDIMKAEEEKDVSNFGSERTSFMTSVRPPQLSQDRLSTIHQNSRSELSLSGNLMQDVLQDSSHSINMSQQPIRYYQQSRIHIDLDVQDIRFTASILETPYPSSRSFMT